MKNILSIATALAATAAFPAFATNSVSIQQVGNGSIEIQQSGEENSVNVNQTPDISPAPPAEKPDPTVKKPEDYQQRVLENPQMTERGRAQAAINEENKDADPKAPPAKNSGSKLKVYQEGKKNRAITTQEGGNSDLLLQQEGKDNQSHHTQTGTNNHSKVIENGDVVEDKQE